MKTLVFALVLVVACGNDPPPAPSATAAAAPAPTPTPTPSPTATSAATVPTVGLPEGKIAAQHILISWKGARRAGGVTRTKVEAKKLAEDVLAKVKAGGDFSQLATEYTDDKGSKDRQGSVGSFRKQDMDPKFSDAAFALPVGGTSDIVETEFGFHIIKRNQ